MAILFLMITLAALCCVVLLRVLISTAKNTPKQRLLQLLMLSAVMALGAVFTVCAVPLLQERVTGRLGLPAVTAVALSIALLLWLLSVFHGLAQTIADALFVKDVHQRRTIQRFAAAQTLDSCAVMRELTEAIEREIPAKRVLLCLRTPGGYAVRSGSKGKRTTQTVLTEDSALLEALRQQTGCKVLRRPQAGDYPAASAEENALLRELDVCCMAPLRSGTELMGLVLLTEKTDGKAYSYCDISFLETICPIAAIAMKNAGLYEKLFREARVDPLTGVLNYSSFMEAVTEAFETNEDNFSLLFVDLDDFKLYNQLYGVEAGDDALRTAADCIRRAAGEELAVYRTSGKVFGVLLPGKDSQMAQGLAEDIHRRLEEVRPTTDPRRMRALTASIGICTAPQNAANAKELMDNADLATHNAKKNGKDRTLIFRGSSRELMQTPERTRAIVEQVERGDGEYRSAMAMIAALTAAIDAKDHYTFAHSQNVAFYAANLAVGAGLNDDQVRMIYAAGLLHDIGKISIPETILNKRGRLDQTEYGIMKDHVNGAIEMIRHLPDMDYLIPAALGHHERWDGMGYPRGIAESEIPVSARCLAIADGFDAMITDRPYRKGLPVDYALSQIEKGAGTQFDPTLSILFINLVRAREIPVQERGVR